MAVWEEQRRCLSWGIPFLGHDSKAVGFGDVLTLPSVSFGQGSTVNGLVELEL